MVKIQEDAVVLENSHYRDDYYLITFSTPTISRDVQPGQFVHLQLPHSPELLLRRPFSIYNCDVDAGTLSLIYKVVGNGTRELSGVERNETVNLLGPLGDGFPMPRSGDRAIIVAGGYGCASTYLIAKNAHTTGICLFGARSRADILVEDEFEKTGFPVKVTTDDGSYGRQGLVTDLLADELNQRHRDLAIYACGPNAMLRAVGLMCLERGLDSYLSFDMPMCCGVGACFTCVLKLKADNRDGWEYVRSCKYGPVFQASEIYWD